jgi:steroid 5-alpha reductase family enzyme
MKMDKKRIIIYAILFTVLVALATQGFMNFGTNGLFIPMLVVMGYFTVFFVIAQIIKDNSIVDMGWGFGFVLGSWTTLFITDSPTLLSYIIVGIISLWGLRLTIRLVKRNWGKPEDFRYANWREEWGDKVVIIAFFRVFMIQGIINFIVGSVGYTIIKYNQFDFTGWAQIIVYLGIAIVLTGLFFEIVGDEQLRKHIQKGERALLKTGLWSITRHPNYFGEILIWNGLFIAGLPLVFNGTVGILYYLSLILSPLVMSAVLIKVSTPLLEKNMEKYDGWDQYKKDTPMIFPWGK